MSIANVLNEIKKYIWRNSFKIVCYNLQWKLLERHRLPELTQEELEKKIDVIPNQNLTKMKRP